MSPVGYHRAMFGKATALNNSTMDVDDWSARVTL
jgi:hypothetical protein